MRKNDAKCNFAPFFTVYQIMHLFSLLLASAISAITSPSDSFKILDVDEVVVTASNKQTSQLRNSAISASTISHQRLESQRINDLNDLNTLVPNFFMPRYGSRLSSALYIRGIGSRINTPAVTLYVDEAPVAEKSEYTASLFNIERIDVLRGPQASMYGRNAMGGIIRIYTRNPFFHQGTDIKISGASRNNEFKFSGITCQKLSDKFAFCAGGFYETDNGFFRNDTLKSKVGGGKSLGGNIRFLFHPNERWNLSLSSRYEYSDENGYPYFYGGQTDGENMADAMNRITSNKQSKYRKNIFNSNFTASLRQKDFVFSSVTSFRNLSDRMFLDQDFTYKDYYTLEEIQNCNTLSEEITFKSIEGRRWEWVGGMFGLYEGMRTHSPVTFYQDGVDMLNLSIKQHLPTITYNYNGRDISMPLSLSFTESPLPIGSYFHTPVLNGAVYFQNTLHKFLHPQLSLTLGLRLDYERQSLRYNGWTDDIPYEFYMPMTGSLPLTAQPHITGKIHDHQTSLLPKIALQYGFPSDKGNVYGVISKGQRSGGYNIQMFSDIMSTVLQNRMMQGTKDKCDQILQEQADQARTEALRNMFLGIKETVDRNIPIQEEPDISTISYKPEYCWNYEAGTHLNLMNRHLLVDFSIFLMNIRNQQISQMVSSGLGRIMTNAGESRSYGLELSLQSYLLNNRLLLHANYGYTNSKFVNYNTGIADYKGKYVPFIPQHNISLSADYNILSSEEKALKNIVIGVRGNGLGRIYWTESNTAWQNFYPLLNAHILLDFGKVSMNFWGENITSTRYKAFYFESSKRKYYQKGNPFQIGVDLHLKF